jgi:predicted outer membrane lipoprotein
VGAQRDQPMSSMEIGFLLGLTVGTVFGVITAVALISARDATSALELDVESCHLDIDP